MSATIEPNDPRLRWNGAVSIQHAKDYSMPWRIPYEKRDLFAWPLVERAAMPAGVTLEFQTDSDVIGLETEPFPDRSPLDIFCDGKFHSSLPSENSDYVKFTDLGSDLKNVEIWLPQHGELKLKSLKIDNSASISQSPTKTNPKWITYGSSITQCRHSDSPRLTWPSIVSRLNDLNLTCLGYGGNCHLDPMVARIIRDSEADLISLCLGINIYTYSSLNDRTFQSGIFGFIELLREKHQKVPIIVLSPIFAAKDNAETQPNDVGFTLRRMRREIEDAVHTMRALGDKNVHYIDGLDIFDETQAHLLFDGVHPNNEGYALMAKKISKLFGPHISNLK